MTTSFVDSMYFIKSFRSYFIDALYFVNSGNVENINNYDLHPNVTQKIDDIISKFETLVKDNLNLDLDEIDDSCDFEAIIHNMVYTITRSGSGFWDGDYHYSIPNVTDDLGQYLTNLIHKNYSEDCLHLYLSDDGMLELY